MATHIESSISRLDEKTDSLASDVDSLASDVNSLASDVNQLKGAYSHLATKNDVSQAVHKLVLWFVGVGLASLGILLSILLNILLDILSRLPS